jgi:hypothetical protein
MRNDINIVARNFRLNKTKLKEFALKPENEKYSITNENGFVTIPTSSTNEFVEAFKKQQVPTGQTEGIVKIAFTNYGKTLRELKG